MSRDYGYIGLGYTYKNSNGTTSTTTGQDLGRSLSYLPGVYMILGDLCYNSINKSTYATRNYSPLYYPFTFSGPVGPAAQDGAWIILPDFALQLYGSGSTSGIAYTDLSDSCSYIYHNVSNNPYLLYTATYYSTSFTPNKVQAQFKNDSYYSPNRTYYIRLWYKCVENTMFMPTNNTHYAGMSTDNISTSSSSIKLLS